MRKVRTKISVIIILIISGCSTPYQPKGLLGGYESENIFNNNYRVSFTANQHTKISAVRESLIKRCAEITVKNGFSFFMIYEYSSYIDIISMDRGPELDQLIANNQEPSPAVVIVRLALEPDEMLVNQKRGIRHRYDGAVEELFPSGQMPAPKQESAERQEGDL